MPKENPPMKPIYVSHSAARLPLTLLITLLLLLPLLAACAGTSEPQQATSPDVVDATEGSAAPNEDRAPAGLPSEEDGAAVEAPEVGRASPAPTPPPPAAPEAALSMDEEAAEEAAEPAAVGDGMGGGADAGRVPPPALESDDEMPEPLPTSAAAAPRNLRGAPAPLKAGERDDNARFPEYLDYLATYRGPPVRLADVSERYIISVLGGNQRPLLDAQVQIFDEQDNLVFEGRTYAGGQTLFLPGVAGVSSNTQEFRLVASREGARAQKSFERHAGETIEIAVPGAQPPEELHLDVLFLLDTTGSMSDELERIQDTIDSIAQRIDAFEPRPNVRFGLVAYRDTGDDYVLRDYDFTPDVDAFREVLATFEADGGGDTPEALEEGLHEAVHGVQWSEGAVRLVFLVADAGPHIERELGYTYIDDAQQAVARGIKIYPIAASNTEPDAEYVFRQLAQQTMGRFIFLTYQPGEASGAPGEHRDDLAAGEAQQFTVERLDDLIVQIIERELAAAVGAQ
jgi:Mg-chelatase subunit ChlD